MKTKHFPLFPASIAASFALLSPTLLADAITWDAGGANTNWSTQLNWSGDASPTSDDVTFNATGALASATTNIVDTSESIASLSYNFESATLQHTTAIAAGQTLTVAGNFSVLNVVAPTAPTNVSITGGTGTLGVTGTSFLLGNPTATTVGAFATSVDMSALGTLSANLSGGSSVFRIGGGGSSGNNFAYPVTLKLAAASTISAATVGVSDFSNFGTLQKMLLGSGATTINTNLLRVGNSVSGRSSGEISFNTATGTLLLRGLAGGIAPVTTMNMVNANSATSNNLISTVNLAGHDVDAKITTLNMAQRSGTGLSATGFLSQATLAFNQGTLEVGTANMAKNSNVGLDGKLAATINIGGGTASFGTLNMAENTSGLTKVTSASLNLTGGSTTVTGSMGKVGGTGATSATLALSGISTVLNMSGRNITGLTSITYTNGLLKNLGVVNTGITLAGSGSRVFDQELNISGSIQGAITGTGVGLTKQGVGALALFGTNTYDGLTQIDAGGLIFGLKSAKTAATATATSLGSVGLGAHDSDALYFSAADIGSLFNSNSLAGFSLDPASGVLIDTTNAGGLFTQNVALNAARTLTKTGTGTLILPLANTFTGNVQINGIATSNTLRIEHSEALGPVATAKTITTTGDNRQVAILELANNISVDINKTINTSGKSYQTTGETAFGSPVFLRSASGNNAWLGNILITGSGGSYSIESAAGTLTLGTPATASVLRNDVIASLRTFNFVGAGNVVVNSQFVDTNLTTSTGINKYGTGTLTLPRTDNQGTLATPVFAVGTTIVENIAASGTPSAIGTGTSFNFGGTFRHAGAANSSSDRAFGLVGPTPTLESSGAGTLALTNTTPVSFVNGVGSSVAFFGLGDTVLTIRDAFTLFPGMTIAATGIATGTKITAVNYDTRQVTLDTPTTAAQTTNQNTTISGTPNLDRTFTLGGTNTGDNLIASPIASPSGTGKLSLTKAGAGKWILTGGNTYTGNTTISGGTLALGAASVLPDASPVAIGSATLDAATAGTEDAGTLAVTGAATINLASGAKIEFDDSNSTWTGTLNLTGFVSGSSLKFANSAGLSTSQLSQISGTGFTGFALDASGFLTATSSGSNFASWANDPLKGNIPGEPAGGDFDNDGIANMVEYALGLNPRVSSQPAGVLASNVITYTKGADAIANGDVSWVIETSQTLAGGSWTAQVTQPAADPALTISHTFTPGTPAKNFARLKVTQP
ncbi:autotransporter-associated beta strand repeat-containing protein [bacterium]|nr:autotransporter-associated beta strand repeat-containing protein [bacterium]